MTGCVILTFLVKVSSCQFYQPQASDMSTKADHKNWDPVHVIRSGYLTRVLVCHVRTTLKGCDCGKNSSFHFWAKGLKSPPWWCVQQNDTADMWTGVNCVKCLESHVMFWVETVKSETWHHVSQSSTGISMIFKSWNMKIDIFLYNSLPNFRSSL